MTATGVYDCDIEVGGKPITLTFRDDINVRLIKSSASDRDVEQAMLVSSDIESTGDPKALAGRINALARERHGTPFEHTFFTFYCEAPIFVYREWHRHRIGVSINEQSGRYSEMPPMFYIPRRDRPLIKAEGTKQMDYVSEQGTDEQFERLVEGEILLAQASYGEYQRRLQDGIVKEVARTCLPLSLYSKQYWSCNARSLMAFLSLRTRRPAFWEPVEVGGETLYRKVEGGAQFPSKPQWEIEQAAIDMEIAFREKMPLTWAAFERNGRVCP